MKKSLSIATLFALAGVAGVAAPMYPNYGPIGPRHGKGSAKRDTDKARAKRRNERKGRKAARARS